MSVTKQRKWFIEKLRQNKFSEQDIALAMYGYDLSKSAHRIQYRDGGDRFFEHPRAVAIILLDEIGTRDINEVIAALLHDTGEDTGMFGNIKESYELFVQTARFRLSRTFNPTVAEHVIALSKPAVDNMYFKDKQAVMDFYTGYLIDRFRSFNIKWADRIHNLRSLLLDNPEKIKKQIKETKEVLLPAYAKSHEKFGRFKMLRRVTVITSIVNRELERLEHLVY